MKKITFTKTLVLVMALGLSSSLFYCNKKDKKDNNNNNIEQGNFPIKSEDFTHDGVIPDRFDGAPISPKFTISNLDPVKHKYLSIIMIDVMNLDGTSVADLAILEELNYFHHWQQSNIDISTIIKDGKITVVSSDDRFNQNTPDNNSSYVPMTPPMGIHRYDFHFFLHDAPKTIEDINPNAEENFENFMGHFNDENYVKFNIWGTITRPVPGMKK